MRVAAMTGRIPTRRVLIAGTAGESRESILSLAMTEARETPSSLFGWTVTMLDNGDAALVTLQTD